MVEIRKDRIRERISELGLTNEHVSQLVTGKRDYIRMLLTRQKSTDLIKAERLAAALQVSVDYLRGRTNKLGEPPKVELMKTTPSRVTRPQKGAAIVKRVNRETRIKQAFDSDDLVRVPEFEVHGAGIVRDAATEERVRRYWALPRDFVISLGLDPEAVAFIEMLGDSMTPALCPGDTILLDLRSKNPALPAIYALLDGPATVCKRLERTPQSEPPLIRVISENEKYLSYEAPAESLNIVGRVAWFARKV